MAAPKTDALAGVRPRVLLVDDEPDVLEVAIGLCGDKMHCDVLAASDLASARKLLSSQPVQLLITDVKLPDGDGTALLEELRAMHPSAHAIVMTGAPSVNGTIQALRRGASDYVTKPFTAKQFVDRVKNALRAQSLFARDQLRLSRLRSAVRKLNRSRRLVSRKVDILCNDLVSAYGELSRQMDAVRIQESFRKLVRSAKDLEQMLCHSMDWLLRHAGYCNVAIFLASDQTHFELGAYMKYTIPGEKAMTDAMAEGLLPLLLREGSLHVDGEQVQEVLTPHEKAFLADQTVLGANCAYLGESLAGVIMFRDRKCPFTDEDAAMLKAIAPVFAVALASVVRDADDDRDDEEGGPGDTGGPWADDDRPRGGRRGSDADWWKRGEAPPF